MRARAIRSGYAALALLCALAGVGRASTTFAVTSLVSLVQIEPGEGHYALWSLLDGNFVFVGQFNTDTDSQHMRDVHTGDRFSSFVTAADLTASSALFVTVEPDSSHHFEPSSHHLMAGTVVANAASLSTQHSLGLGASYADANGSFILDSPTTSSTSDYASGVWFLRPDSPDGAGIDLPPPPDGWIYETWVSDAGSADPIPMSMGEFADPAQPDINGGGGGAGPGAPPPFPGQDFIVLFEDQPVMPNLAKGEWALVVSIEPKPNTGPNPFHSLEPLLCNTIANLTRRQVQSLFNNTDQFPTMAVAMTVQTPVRHTTWGALKAAHAAR